MVRSGKISGAFGRGSFPASSGVPENATLSSVARVIPANRTSGAGALAGGALVARLGINRSLWIIGFLQAVSNLGYVGLAVVGRNYPFLVGAIVVENFCGGLVAAGFMAFLMSLCTTRFSATQFALLSSLMGVSRDVLVAPAGRIAQATGWPVFFLITLGAAIPGMLLLPLLAPWSRVSPIVAAGHPG